MQIHHQAWEIFTHFTRSMTKAALVSLEYGQRYPHTTHLVLMQGTLTLSHDSAANRKRSQKRIGEILVFIVLSSLLSCWAVRLQRA